MEIFKKNLTAIVLFSLVCFACAAAESKWVCSITEAKACMDDGTVGKPDLGGLDQPTFLSVDTESREVRLLAPASRRGEVSAIETARREEGRWLFTGVERGRIWSMTITDAGYMTLSMVGDGEVWSVFGHAIERSLLED